MRDEYANSAQGGHPTVQLLEIRPIRLFPVADVSCKVGVFSPPLLLLLQLLLLLPPALHHLSHPSLQQSMPPHDAAASCYHHLTLLLPPFPPPSSSLLQIAPSVDGSLHGSWNPPWTSGIIALVVIVAVLAGILLEGLMLSHRYECPHLWWPQVLKPAYNAASVFGHAGYYPFWCMLHATCRHFLLLVPCDMTSLSSP